ncbi:MAG: hypothetical protein OYH77_01115 [Pseudomonadota bacterium]|nr:hypothetical protein [Pseudomonadota bacterium]
MGRRGLQRFATNDWQVAYKDTGNLQTEREEQACLLFNRSAGCLAQPNLATRHRTPTYDLTDY